jgi:hypothetical protein
MIFNEILINQRLFVDPNAKVECTPLELGYILKINDKIVIQCNYKSIFGHEGDNAIFQVDIEKPYTPEILNSHYIGFNELPNFIIDLDWYDKDIDPSLILKSWQEYKEQMNLSKIMAFLVYRDATIMNECIKLNYKYPLITPSWDICILLPYYLKLCENIPGRKIKLKRAGEVVKQISNLVGNFYKKIEEGQTYISPKDLDDLLRKAHSQSDELAVAHRLSKLNFNIEFGNPRTQPDYIINGFRVEHKSKFPDRSLSNETINIMKFKDVEETRTLRNLAEQMTPPDEGLEKEADIFINNITRMPVSKELYGLSLKGFKLYPDINSFDKVMSDAMHLAEKGKIIIPYIFPICSNPRIISFPMGINHYTSLSNSKL